MYQNRVGLQSTISVTFVPRGKSVYVDFHHGCDVEQLFTPTKCSWKEILLRKMILLIGKLSCEQCSKSDIFIREKSRKQK